MNDAVTGTGDGPVLSGPHVVVAGGGTAGHIEPALAFADAVLRICPEASVTALGTERGLEGTLVPQRGYSLEMIPPVPMPRKPTPELLRLPGQVRRAVRSTRDVLDRLRADVLVGFGGYVALPAYLAARGRCPIVVHEANRHPGLANRVGARFADAVGVAVEGTPLPGARLLGMPLRRSITSLDRDSIRAQASAHFGLDPDAPTLVVVGGSQGARSINTAVSSAAQAFADAGIGVLHAHGPRNSVAVPDFPGRPAYVQVPYVERMDLAYAAADMVLCRSGAMTVAEVSAVGLPAVYVPLPHGNGEQTDNAAPAVEAGAALMLPDAELSAERLVERVIPLLRDPQQLDNMSAAAGGLGHATADEELARLALQAAKSDRPRT